MVFENIPSESPKAWSAPFGDAELVLFVRLRREEEGNNNNNDRTSSTRRRNTSLLTAVAPAPRHDARTAEFTARWNTFTTSVPQVFLLGRGLNPEATGGRMIPYTEPTADRHWLRHVPDTARALNQAVRRLSELGAPMIELDGGLIASLRAGMLFQDGPHGRKGNHPLSPFAFGPRTISYDPAVNLVETEFRLAYSMTVAEGLEVSEADACPHADTPASAPFTTIPIPFATTRHS